MRQLTYDDERDDFENRLKHINANRHPLSLVLDGLEDIRNVGSIFRIADAANIEHIYFHNCSVSVQDKRIKKTSRSTHQYISSSVIDVAFLKKIKETHQLLALEITSESIPYTDVKIIQPTLMVIGAENYGVSKPVLELIDQSIHIPMYGINTSMNVANAVAIATFHIIQQF